MNHLRTLLQSIGFTNATVSGDTRFDRVAAIASDVKENPTIERFKNGKNLFIAGSTWQQDEEIIAELIESNQSRIEKFIIVPHEVDKESNRIYI
jgi:3-deoxy-D-manno-octulosonic-acid transferase